MLSPAKVHDSSLTRTRRRLPLSRKAAVLFVSMTAPLLTAAMDMASFTVPLNGFTDAIYTQRATVYRLKVTGDEFEPFPASTQRVLALSRNGSQVFADIECGPDAGSSPKENPASLKKYTGDARFLNIAWPGIAAEGKKLRHADNPAAVAEEFVFRHITDKRFGIPLISADQAYLHRTGDCTEHAVLAVALLRAAGLPARAVVGMILETEFLGRRNVFVFHMWAETHIGGKWVQVDATRPGRKHPNRYIALAHHSLKSEAPLEYLSALAAIENMEVSYIRGR